MDYEKMAELTRQNLSANFYGKNQKSEKMKNQRLKKFEFKLKNTSDEDITLALIQGTYPSLEELQTAYNHIDGLFLDGECVKVSAGGEVTATAKKGRTFAHLLSMVDKGFDFVVRDIEVMSADRGNFAENIEVTVTSVFEKVDMTTIRIADYLSTEQNDGNRVICRSVNIPLTAAHAVTFTVRANSEIDFIMRIG